MDAILCAYFAGVIDCDGSIQVMRTQGPKRKRDGKRPHYFMVRVTVTQVDRTIHDLLIKSFGGHIYRYDRPNGGKGYWYTWTVSSKKALVILQMVRPYLQLKTKQADAAMSLIALIDQQNASRSGHEVITDEQESQRLSLLHEVRLYNARPKATRNRELLPQPPI